MSVTIYLKGVVLACSVAWLLGGCERVEVKIDGNTHKEPQQFRPGFIQDPQCKMEVTQLVHSAQAVLEDGKTFVFDDVGCMVLWIDQNNLPIETLVLWVYTTDTKRYIDAAKAWYSRDDKTPMGYGFGAYEASASGRVGFEQMRPDMLQGINLTNPAIRKKILGE